VVLPISDIERLSMNENAFAWTANSTSPTVVSLPAPATLAEKPLGLKSSPFPAIVGAPKSGSVSPADMAVSVTSA
jgi:hypothetical protein